MKIGIKIFHEEKFARHFEYKADFLEVMAIEGEDYSFLKNYNLPIVVHSQHEKFGVNFADKTIRDRNLRSIRFAIKLANTLDSEKIILHPGKIFDSNCSIEEAINTIKSLDFRILIENLPKKSKENKFNCTNPVETSEFLDKVNKGLCFDINHAISTALTFKLDYLEIIKEFVKLKPRHYHIGGQLIKGDVGHLALDEGDINLKEILKLLPKDAEITLETKPDISKTENDLRIIKEIIDSI